jgi:glyoxylate reductase
MAKPHIFVTRQIPHEGIDLLKKHCDVTISSEDRPLTRPELLAGVAKADGVLCLLTDKIDTEVFNAAHKAKGFATYAVGYDNIDVAEATRRKIPISNTPGVLTHATAEMAWALLFSMARRIVESDAVMRSGNWKGWGPMQFIGGDITGKTLGIVGAGRIGTAMAFMSKGFTMKVLYTGSKNNEVLDKELGAQKVSLDELISQSDYISLHVPLKPETRHLFGMAQFKKMKPTAYLINTARGPVVNESELVQALSQNIIAGAGLDVYEFEPKMVEGLAALTNVVIAPHTASATTSTRANMSIKAATNLLAMVQEKRAPDCLNPQVYE